MNIEMVSQILVVKKILKKTKTRFFQHLKVGDTFVIKKTLKQQSAASHGMYSVYLTCHRLDGLFPDESLSINEIMKATSLFQFVEKPFIALLKEEKNRLLTIKVKYDTILLSSERFLMKFFKKCKYWAEIAWIVFTNQAAFWLGFGIIYMGMGVNSAIKDEGNFLPWRWFLLGLFFCIPTFFRLLKVNK